MRCILAKEQQRREKKMILAIDIGNSNIVIGAVEKNKVHFESRLSTDRRQTEDQLAISFLDILTLYRVDREAFDGCIISSVVPQLNQAFSGAVKKVVGITPVFIGPGVKTGLKINTNNPSQLGSDLVVDNVAARALYNTAVIVIDMGTATTISTTDSNNNFLGCAIMPGVTISLNALTNNTSLLQGISLDNPKKAIETNTTDCMKSGIIYGNASMLDGMLDRFINELSEKGIKKEEITIVATGGHSKYIIPYCRHNIVYEKNLLLTGLYIIWENQNKERK